MLSKAFSIAATKSWILWLKRDQDPNIKKTGSCESNVHMKYTVHWSDDAGPKWIYMGSSLVKAPVYWLTCVIQHYFFSNSALLQKGFG